MLRGAEQHRGVAIVAATVHPTRILRGVRETIVFGHRQRVHVGAKSDRASAVAAFAAQHADQAGLAQAAMYFDTPLFQLSGDEIGRAIFMKRQFGVRMDIATNGGQAFVFPLDFSDQAHVICSFT